MKITDTKYLFPCDCHDAHYLAIYFDQEDTYPPFMWIEEKAQFVTARERIKGAWQRLTGRWDSSREIVLNVETILQLRNTLNEILEFELRRQEKQTVTK